MNKLKIAYLASPLSIHTVRWVNEMAQRGHEIHLLTVHGTGLNPLDSRVGCGHKVTDNDVRLPFAKRYWQTPSVSL